MNPLVDLQGLPAFSQILPEHAEPAISHIITDNRRQLEALIAEGDYSWEGLIKPMEALDNRLNCAFAPIRHCYAVCNSEAWRQAYSACLPIISDYATEIGQNEALCKAYQQVAASSEFTRYSPAQRKVIENALRDFRLAGVDLPANKKARYKEIVQSLSSLSAKFDDHVLDATQAWKKHLIPAQALAGLPERALAQLQQNAVAAGHAEGYLLGLDFPSYQAVITYAKDRDLRRTVYEAYSTRASEQGPQAGQFDNGPVIEEILRLRHEAAQLLGFANFAEESMVTKMAPDVDTVEKFLLDLALRAKPVAQNELIELTEFARRSDNLARLESWDITYYSERLRQEKYQLSEEELRPYFPAYQVLKGMFGIVEKLYGIAVREITDVDTWHNDVEFYEVRTAQGELRGHFYVDLYARANKRGGAWMDDCIGRRRVGEAIQAPVAFLTCNFTPPVGDRPALLTHDEVLTLFHEFGHGLHHLLTQVDHLAVSGINGVAWDAVELPSQFMENFCWQRASLDLISGHIDTHQPIPEALRQHMLAARNFQAAMQMVRQLEFSIFDLRLHRDYNPTLGASVTDVLGKVREEISVVKPPVWNRFPNSFSHIFAGGYAAGYYSYKWAEVLAADAFEAFEQEGVLHRMTGERFLRTVLEQGGSKDAGVLFAEFRGREPSIEPLLRLYGLVA